MQKIKFDFEATKERIYAPNSNVPIGAPVDQNGNIANDGNAYGIVLCKETENEKYWVRYNLVVMVAGYCDIIDAQEIWGGEYSAEAIAAMSDIIFCDDHKIGGGGGWPADLPKPSVGGYGYTEQGEQTVITWDGDTEGRTFFADFGINYYKIEDVPDGFEPNLVAGISDLSGVISDYVVDDQRDMAGVINVGATGGANALIVVNADKYASVTGADVTQSGVYFVKAEVSGTAYQITSLTYGTPDTVHKIDEKYLPASGGVFEIFYNSATNAVDKTYAEIKQAYYAGKNVTLRIAGDVILHVSMIPVPDDDLDDAIVFSGLADIYIDADAAELQSANVYQVAISSDESVTFEQGYFGFE